MRLVSGVVAVIAAICVAVPERGVDRPKPDWYQQACSIIDGEDDPC